VEYIKENTAVTAPKKLKKIIKKTKYGLIYLPKSVMLMKAVVWVIGDFWFICFITRYYIDYTDCMGNLPCDKILNYQRCFL